MPSEGRKFNSGKSRTRWKPRRRVDLTGLRPEEQARIEGIAEKLDPPAGSQADIANIPQAMLPFVGPMVLKASIAGMESQPNPISTREVDDLLRVKRAFGVPTRFRLFCAISMIGGFVLRSPLNLAHACGVLLPTLLSEVTWLAERNITNLFIRNQLQPCCITTNVDITLPVNVIGRDV